MYVRCSSVAPSTRSNRNVFGPGHARARMTDDKANDMKAKYYTCTVHTVTSIT